MGRGHVTGRCVWERVLVKGGARSGEDRWGCTGPRGDKAGRGRRCLWGWGEGRRFWEG